MQMKAFSVAGIVTLILGVILLIGVALPVVVKTVSDASLTGVAKTLGDYFPVFIMIGGVLLVLRSTEVI